MSNDTVEDRHPVGGFVTRMMPPTSFHHGDIPPECCNPALGIQEIRRLITAEYLKPGNFQRLLEWFAWRDHKTVEELDGKDRMCATIQVEMVAEIDADTIFWYNLDRANPPPSR